MAHAALWRSLPIPNDLVIAIAKIDGIEIRPNRIVCSMMEKAVSRGPVRWSRILRQGHKVDRLMKRTIRSEDTQTVYGRVQGQGGA